MAIGYGYGNLDSGGPQPPFDGLPYADPNNAAHDDLLCVQDCARQSYQRDFPQDPARAALGPGSSYFLRNGSSFGPDGFPELLGDGGNGGQHQNAWRP